MKRKCPVSERIRKRKVNNYGKRSQRNHNQRELELPRIRIYSIPDCVSNYALEEALDALANQVKILSATDGGLEDPE